VRHALVVALLASAFSSVQGQWQFTLKRDEMTDEDSARQDGVPKTRRAASPHSSSPGNRSRASD